ncbi:MAG: hypothetical protein K2L21_03275, partial [Muribaculaceae bacterium]|nr:hypothetical protein [Muribaculaceae bacterium]
FAKSPDVSNLTKVKIQRCMNGAIIDGTPYSFRRNTAQSAANSETPQPSLPVYKRVASIQDSFKTCVEEWEETITSNLTADDNIFLSSNDLALVNRMLKEVSEQIKTIEVKLGNIAMMIK